MNTSQLPIVIYHNLNELIEKAELETALNIVQQQLHKGHITSILNDFKGDAIHYRSTYLMG